MHQQPAFQDILDLTLCDSKLDTTSKNATDILGQDTTPALPSTQNHAIYINAPQSQPDTTHASLIHGPSKSGFPLKYACDMDHCFKHMNDLPGNSKTKIKFKSVYGGIPYVSSTYSDHFKIWKKVKDTLEFASAVAAGHSTEGLWSTVF
ncbi:hypothetical protein JR316_0003283 [Psilocybe cubensis]|uniref:Uncharacterized protein n=2 Tax=Psilocybe cubensis TaxID=181762 RepID=A0A8H7Y2E8_PSICU|nr:hypothetical protein JR316_0003283 [Psilocybe cubensis]KAH9483805.1 hypothetical protein JR316_0003283 [Psilocybe cubensis]